jgi:RNA polymerase sigma-70 factor (ECF subfamily)
MPPKEKAMMSAEFAALMRLHGRALFRAARAILRDDAAAEDACQEAWLRAYRSIGSYRGEAKLSTWLMRIAINEALQLRRRMQRAPAPAEPASTLDELPLPAAEEPEHASRRRELRELVDARIDALPGPLRAVFVLRAKSEHSVREVAALLHIPEATVKTRFFRARARLRLALSSLRSLEA